jgi:hypothetical protein
VTQSSHRTGRRARIIALRGLCRHGWSSKPGSPTSGNIGFSGLNHLLTSRGATSRPRGAMHSSTAGLSRPSTDSDFLTAERKHAPQDVALIR